MNDSFSGLGAVELLAPTVGIAKALGELDTLLRSGDTDYVLERPTHLSSDVASLTV